MKIYPKAIFTPLLLLSLGWHSTLADGPFVEVPLSDPHIFIQGAKFTRIEEDGIHFNRFDDSILQSTSLLAKVDPKRARTTSGVVLSFLTHSKQLRLSFKYIDGEENRGSQFGLYVNGAFTGESKVSGKEPSAVIELVAPAAVDGQIRYDVALPSWSNPVLTQVEIEEGNALEAGDVVPHQTVVFLGDSITHGTGQGSASYRNYPFIASRKLNVQGFNLAVGGGRISPPVAALLQHFEPVEVIWILVGYNNWQGRSQEIATITAEYEELLDTIRRYQPQAEILCCTLTYTRNTRDQESGVTAAAVREAVSSLVRSRIDAGDGRMFLIDGASISSEENLPMTNDPVHFSEEGAALIAEEVCRIIRPHLTMQ